MYSPSIPPSTRAPLPRRARAFRPYQAPRFTWQEIAAAAWILGSFALLAYWGIGHRRALHRIRVDARIPDDALLGLVEECRHVIGLRRRPEVIESQAIASPAVTGLLRPVLLLPAGLRERFSHDELRLMLCTN
jgi:beta-lactamase regulating signal transducer with metallopeptidase domain